MADNPHYVNQPERKQSMAFLRSRESIEELRMTDAEIEALRGVSLPAEVRKALQKDPNELAVTTAAYRKGAGMLRAQADFDKAYVEAAEARQARLDVETGDADMAKLRRERDEARMELRQANQQNVALQREKELMIASPLAEAARGSR